VQWVRKIFKKKLKKSGTKWRVHYTNKKKVMKNTHELKTGGFYVFESLCSANSIFFKSEIEINLFKKLIKQHLTRFLDITKLYIDTNGYQIVVRIKQRRTVLKNYKEDCKEKQKTPKLELLNTPWKIISEKMRIFKSTFVKAINRLRGREGVLVKNSFKKVYFETLEEYEKYIVRMETGKEIPSQHNPSFCKRRTDTKVKDWMKYRVKKWAENLLNIESQLFVKRKIITSTLSHHNPSHNSHSNL
jgi:hypothetical protein